MKTSSSNVARAAATVRDPRWAAVAARDGTADGRFFYAVMTTGVYCRPSCPARLAHPQNVRFFASGAQAERAGFRACKRCKPDQVSLRETQVAQVAKICRLIERAPAPPTLAQLARDAGMSVFHFHRVFKSVTGLTPKAYAVAHLARRVRGELARAATITEAIFDAGYQSSGRFYEKSNAMLGMTPTQFRADGADTEIQYALGRCSLGAVLVAASARGICAILLGDTQQALERDLQQRFAHAKLFVGAKPFQWTICQVIDFIDKSENEFKLPLDLRGTVFQQRVWLALQKIPPGATVTYREIAQRIGAPKAVRAVAGACAANALAVVIPCHRVLRTDGGLAGYRWGVKRKKALLARELAKGVK